MTKIYLLFIVTIFFSGCSRNLKKDNSINKDNPDSTQTKINSSALESNGFIESRIKSDTLLIVSTNEFLYYPFGIYSNIEDIRNQYSFNVKISYNDEYPFKDTTTNKLRVYKINFKNSFVKFTKGDNNNMEIVSARVLDKELHLSNGVKVGITKKDFINQLSLKEEQHQLNKINIVELESGLTGIWHYYFFKNDTLSYFIIDSDFQLEKD